MAPLPKRRHSTRRQGKRRHRMKIGAPEISKCLSCSSDKLPHQLCPSCGYYSEKIRLTQKQKPPKEKK